MPHTGVHAMAGILARRWMPHKEWLIRGVVLGSMFPHLDNLAVASQGVARELARATSFPGFDHAEDLMLFHFVRNVFQPSFIQPLFIKIKAA